MVTSNISLEYSLAYNDMLSFMLRCFPVGALSALRNGGTHADETRTGDAEDV